ncbi:MAG TPA: DUF4406 domain-containing protein [Candidatus Saccharimonadales bacterium]|nr:DUF4406 domain-containing protein [Candidatus Saccharimonadales bacterium]
MNQTLKVYVAGKMRGHSGFANHTWRDEFLEELAKLTGLRFISFDPTRAQKNYDNLELVFGSDVHMIDQVDVVIVYVSDDISVGASQEILIAKYFKKPVIAYAPAGGHFNGGTKEVAGVLMTDYKHPFLFSTCDQVCGSISELAEALTNLDKLEVKALELIDKAKNKFAAQHSKAKLYEEHFIG